MMKTWKKKDANVRKEKEDISWRMIEVWSYMGGYTATDGGVGGEEEERVKT